MSISAEDIFGAIDITRECVKVPEWGGEVYVQVMDGESRDSLEQSCQPSAEGKKPDLANFRARVCVRTMVNEMGVRLFKDSDYPKLGKKSSLVLDRVFAVAQRINGLRQEDVDALAKNSAPDQTAVSGSSCPTDTAPQSGNSSEK